MRARSFAVAMLGSAMVPVEPGRRCPGPTPDARRSNRARRHGLQLEHRLMHTCAIATAAGC